MTRCPICGQPYGRLNRHVGPGNCLERALDFLSLELPGFTLIAKLDDGTPFVLSYEDTAQENHAILTRHLNSS